MTQGWGGQGLRLGLGGPRPAGTGRYRGLCETPASEGLGQAQGRGPGGGLCTLSGAHKVKLKQSCYIFCSRGRVFTFGCGLFGQLGTGDTSKAVLPREVAGV